MRGQILISNAPISLACNWICRCWSHNQSYFSSALLGPYLCPWKVLRDAGWCSSNYMNATHSGASPASGNQAILTAVVVGAEPCPVMIGIILICARIFVQLKESDAVIGLARLERRPRSIPAQASPQITFGVFRGLSPFWSCFVVMRVVRIKSVDIE